MRRTSCGLACKAEVLLAFYIIGNARPRVIKATHNGIPDRAGASLFGLEEARVYFGRDGVRDPRRGPRCGGFGDGDERHRGLSSAVPRESARCERARPRAQVLHGFQGVSDGRRAGRQSKRRHRRRALQHQSDDAHARRRDGDRRAAQGCRSCAELRRGRKAWDGSSARSAEADLEGAAPPRRRAVLTGHLHVQPRGAALARGASAGSTPPPLSSKKRTTRSATQAPRSSPSATTRAGTSRSSRNTKPISSGATTRRNTPRSPR